MELHGPPELAPPDTDAAVEPEVVSPAGLAPQGSNPPEAPALQVQTAQSLPAEPTDGAPAHELVPLPVPPPRGLSNLDAGTIVAGVVVVLGLIVAAWLRQGGFRTANSKNRAATLLPSGDTDATISTRSGASFAADHTKQIETLAQLVREADARIRELRTLKAELRSLGVTPAQREQHTNDRQPVEPANEFDSSPISPRETPASPDALAPADPLAHRIVELARAGKTPVEIAGELHEHTGKIELILALERVRPTRQA
ncbi:MAG: hypothetical protein ACKVZJ_13155 [Phycisphaerales bacterium]